MLLLGALEAPYPAPPQDSGRLVVLSVGLFLTPQAANAATAETHLSGSPPCPKIPQCQARNGCSVNVWQLDTSTDSARCSHIEKHAPRCKGQQKGSGSLHSRRWEPPGPPGGTPRERAPCLGRLLMAQKKGKGVPGRRNSMRKGPEERKCMGSQLG